MSIETARAFVEKLKSDAELAQKVHEAEDTESKLQIAKQEGYEFTAQEAKQVQEELSDEDLDSVAGGFIKESVAGICLVHW
jgi:predicted ribosomally synthesized peptide with nif11-like leader